MWTVETPTGGLPIIDWRLIYPNTDGQATSGVDRVTDVETLGRSRTPGTKTPDPCPGSGVVEENRVSVPGSPPTGYLGFHTQIFDLSRGDGRRDVPVSRSFSYN